MPADRLSSDLWCMIMLIINTTIYNVQYYYARTTDYCYYYCAHCSSDVQISALRCTAVQQELVFQIPVQLELVFQTPVYCSALECQTGIDLMLINSKLKIQHYYNSTKSSKQVL
jgi:hypothetical protein